MVVQPWQVVLGHFGRTINTILCYCGRFQCTYIRIYMCIYRTHTHTNYDNKTKTLYEEYLILKFEIKIRRDKTRSAAANNNYYNIISTL